MQVHTHNLVEDNLNKAVYDPIFRFFLATIGVVETELLVVPVGESAEDKKQVTMLLTLVMLHCIAV